MDTGAEICCNTKSNFRLVCHKCNEKGPINAVGIICNCKNSDVHIHCVDHPCAMCCE